ncbi:hypothetical protein [Streptomyces sp. NPDC097640]|uniref:hypothetical protein n=1 Tax=Streptomyces sp. NPDC097640 TaxID=3157229 RepID=UPI003323E79E
MTRSSSTATKRRGVALAAAVGVLTLGAVASASAAGPSHTASKGSAAVVSAAKGSKLCVVAVGKPVQAAKAFELDKAVPAVPAAKAGKATKVVKPAKAIKIVKNGDGIELSVVKGVPGKPIRTVKCPVLAFPGKPGKPGVSCKVVAHKNADLALKGIAGKKCHVTPVPATPKKR